MKNQFWFLLILVTLLGFPLLAQTSEHQRVGVERKALKIPAAFGDPCFGLGRNFRFGDWKSSVDASWSIPLGIWNAHEAAEKHIKAIILSKSGILQKTHDLGLLLDLLSEKIEIPEGIYDSCDNLTPYGVKARYPQELYLEEKHAQKALADAEKIHAWCSKISD